MLGIEISLFWFKQLITNNNKEKSGGQYGTSIFEELWGENHQFSIWGNIV